MALFKVGDDGFAPATHSLRNYGLDKVTSVDLFIALCSEVGLQRIVGA